MAAAARCRSLALTLLLAFSVVVAAAAADDGEAALKHLHFYFHEIDAGAPNATVANVASLHRNGSKLGDVAVAGPGVAAHRPGQALGVHTSLDGATASAAIVFVFSSGEYAGSTLATQGVYNTSGGPAERSIVGGTSRCTHEPVPNRPSSVVSSTDTSYVVVFDLYFTLAY
ncbi:hypothetical protein HU200_057924 [Digitaria exilis]|uniref:Dirigent protein n=1 Tax=Digitaria exilis TaxID=1010633 RepID=A0A835AP36_9POAL|nr:hypothetical protein HU200_057924 [Digitaria exilis]